MYLRRRQDFEGWTRTVIIGNETQLTKVETRTDGIDEQIPLYHSTEDNNAKMLIMPAR